MTKHDETLTTTNIAAWVIDHAAAAERITGAVNRWEEMSKYALFDQRFDRLASRYEELAVEELQAAGVGDSFADAREIVRVAKIILG